jgi:hypothetical protein
MDNPTGALSLRTESCDPDGLETEWSDRGLVYVNPPYGRNLMWDWAVKCIEEARNGCEIVLLARGDTSTRWARLLIENCNAVAFPPRIRFAGAIGSPNFSNIIYYFGTRVPGFRETFRDWPSLKK